MTLALPSAAEDIQVTIGADGTISTADLPKIEPEPGYLHTGWTMYDGEDAKFYLLKDVPPLIRINSSEITFVAVFDEEPVPPHTVTYKNNAQTVKSESVAHNSTNYNPPLTTSLTAPTDKRFKFWTENDTTEYNFSTPVTRDITLTAIWENKPISSGSGGGGSSTGTVEKEVIKEVIVEKEVVVESDYGISNKLKSRLETVQHLKYLNGYEDGTVHPDSEITRAEVAAIFFRLSKVQSPVPGGKFADVEPGAWYAPAVNFLANVGILTGYEDGKFRPEQNITRAEFAAIASQFDDLTANVTNPFTDVTDVHWAYRYTISAYAKGWISGYPGGEFLPGNAITRAEVVTIVNKMLARRVRTGDIDSGLHTKFSDLSYNHWAFADIIEASTEHSYTRDADWYEIWK
jgi:hypothetical protein